MCKKCYNKESRVKRGLKRNPKKDFVLVVNAVYADGRCEEFRITVERSIESASDMFNFLAAHTMKYPLEEQPIKLQGQVYRFSDCLPLFDGENYSYKPKSEKDIVEFYEATL